MISFSIQFWSHDKKLTSLKFLSLNQSIWSLISAFNGVITNVKCPNLLHTNHAGSW